jgi:hypothetical protein
MNKLLVLCAAVALVSTQAQAMCRDDIRDMKPRIDRIKNSEPQRYWLAMRWWGRAVEVEPGSELECTNSVEKARKALAMPMEQANNCNAANTYLPRCTPGGLGAAYGGPGAPAAGFDLGGAGGPNTPVFTPPGSVNSPSSSSSPP